MPDLTIIKKYAQQVVNETQTGCNKEVAGAMTRLMAYLYEYETAHQPSLSDNSSSSSSQPPRAEKSKQGKRG